MPEPALIERPEAETRLIKRRSGLSPSDLALMLKMQQEGLTQAQIGQRFNLHQTYVSKCLAGFTDTTPLAKEYLRGSALSMAKNIVKKGRAADHVAALKGLSVLAEESAGGLVVQIGGGSKVQVNVGLSPSITVTSGEGVQKA